MTGDSRVRPTPMSISCGVITAGLVVARAMGTVSSAAQLSSATVLLRAGSTDVFGRRGTGNDDNSGFGIGGGVWGSARQSGGRDTDMRLVTHANHEGVRVQLHGSVAAGGDPALSAGLGALLREHPCVVADLDRLDGTDFDTVTGIVLVLVDAVGSGGGWPAAALVVSCPDAGLRETLRSMPALVNVVLTGSVRQARRRCGERPDRLSAEWTFSDEPSVLVNARWLVATRARSWFAAAPGWDVDDVVMVVNELLTNALEHARSDAVLRMTLVRDTLEVTVRDCSTDPPRPQPFSPSTSRGRGLQMIDALFDQWGWVPHDDGKVVWARVTRPAPGG